MSKNTNTIQTTKYMEKISHKISNFRHKISYIKTSDSSSLSIKLIKTLLKDIQ